MMELYCLNQLKTHFLMICSSLLAGWRRLCTNLVWSSVWVPSSWRCEDVPLDSIESLPRLIKLPCLHYYDGSRGTNATVITICSVSPGLGRKMKKLGDRWDFVLFFCFQFVVMTEKERRKEGNSWLHGKHLKERIRLLDHDSNIRKMYYWRRKGQQIKVESIFNKDERIKGREKNQDQLPAR